jgi:S-adenosylmethionine-dependent methyltransferase
MQERQPTFDRVGREYIDKYYNQVRGYVRQELTRMNLSPYLVPEGGVAADVGGGDGRDSEWLASKNYSVVLAEPSNLIEDAQERKGDIQCIRTDAKGLLSDAGKDRFDLVLSHGVVMYDDQPADQIKDIVALAKPGGIVSMLVKGYLGAYTRLQKEGDIQGKAALRATGRFTNNLGEEVWALEPQKWERMLTEAGADILNWSGVRIHSEYDTRKLQHVDQAELAKIVINEHHSGNDRGLRARGQMLHFIARKF